jgi:hypothetical protein
LFEFLIKLVNLFIRAFKKNEYLFKAQHPDDHRNYYKNRPILELTLDFAKWLHHAPESSDTLKSAERFDIKTLL